MNVILLYLLLVKATCTSFSGLASLPIIRADLVEHYHVLTDDQLNTAVAAGRSGPGPIGIYVVCVGYQVAGAPGAAAGLLASMTPAFIIIGLLRLFGKRVDQPHMQRTIRAILAAAGGLLAATTIGLAGSAVRDGFTGTLAALAFLLFAFTRADSVWVMLSAAAAGVLWKLGTAANGV
jgi:chromate transporter